MATPHFIKSDAVRDRCIELYCLVKAPCPPKEEGDPLLETFVFNYRAMISFLLLDIATMARVLDDILRSSESEQAMGQRQYDDVVATFTSGGKGELTLRETLNKIIHAELVELVCDGIKDEWQEEEDVCRHHTGDVVLSGRMGKQDWVVQLSPIPFCREVLGWLDSAEEFGRLHKLYQ